MAEGSAFRTGRGPVEELALELRSVVEQLAAHAVEGVERAKSRRLSVIEEHQRRKGSAEVDCDDRGEPEGSQCSEEWITFLEELLRNQSDEESTQPVGESERQGKRVGVLKKHSQYNLYQVRALQQHDKFSCGYFALYFASHALYALQHRCTAEELHSLACRAGYYHYKAVWQEQLRRHAKHVDNYYPWDDESIATGIVERPYILHLIDNDPELQALGGAERLCALHDFTKVGVCQGIVGIERLQRLDFVAAEFKRRERYHQAFIVGSIAHWMVVVVRKVGPGKFESIFIDSYNHMIMEKSLGELEGMVNQYLDAHPSSDPSARPRRLRTGVGIHCGMQFALETLHELIVGDLVMVEEGLRLRLDRFVSAYCEATNTRLPPSSGGNYGCDSSCDSPITLDDKSEVHASKEEYVNCLLAWLHDGFHPRFISTEAEDIATSFKNLNIRPSTLSCLKSWIDHIDAVIEEVGMIPGDVLADSENLVARFFTEAVPAFRAVLCQCSL